MKWVFLTFLNFEVKFTDQRLKKRKTQSLALLLCLETCMCVTGQKVSVPVKLLLGLVYDELFLKRFRTKMYRTKTEKQEPLVCTI